MKFVQQFLKFIWNISLHLLSSQDFSAFQKEQPVPKQHRAEIDEEYRKFTHTTPAYDTHLCIFFFLFQLQSHELSISFIDFHLLNLPPLPVQLAHSRYVVFRNSHKIITQLNERRGGRTTPGKQWKNNLK